MEGCEAVGLVEVPPSETYVEKEPEVIPGEGEKRERLL